MSNTILKTKFYIPPLRPNLIPRPHLTKQLATGVTCPLTLIAAPAGFGKSTLLSEWLQGKDEGGGMKDEDSFFHPSSSPTLARAVLHPSRVAWLSLDKDDNEPVRFLTYFIAALETVSPGLSTDALALLQSPQPPPWPVILPSLINSLSSLPHQLVLVLDDYHVITTPAIHEALIFLLDHLPLQLRLIIASRIDPSLPLARLRVRNQLYELRAHDLRFSAAEAATFLHQVMGLSLSVEEVAILEQRTEGWIAGLQLAALSMQGRGDLAGFIQSFTGSHAYIVDYLAEEVLNRQPNSIQDFLLQTSILDRMCGSLCDAVLRNASREGGTLRVKAESKISGSASSFSPHPSSFISPSSSLILEQLEHANLFLIPLDEERRWYRYHHLFADVLRNRLRQASSTSARSLAGAAELHGRASAWFEQEGLIDEAIRHALAAPDIERAAALIERHSMAVLLRSEVLLIRTWLEQLPQALVQTRPRLILAHGWILTLTGHHQAAEQGLATPQALTALQSPDLPPDILGELALLRATIARARRDDTSAFELAQQALNYLPDDDRGLQAGAVYTMGVAQLRQGDIAAASQTLAEATILGETKEGPYIALIALQELSELQARQGQLSQVIQTCQRAMRLVTRWGGQRMPAAGMAHIYIGEVLYERNDLAGAAPVLTDGTDLLRGSIEQSLLAQGYVALARVQLAQGNAEGAFATIQRGENWFTQMQIADSGSGELLALGKARLWLRQGQLTAPARWAQSCRWWPEGTNLGYLQQLTLARLRLAQSQRDPHGQFLPEAAQILDPLLVAAEAGCWMQLVIESLVLQALVCQAQGNPTGALTILERALVLAEPEGYIRIFVDEGEPMAELLKRMNASHEAGGIKQYIHKLLAVFGKDERPPLHPSSFSPHPLVESLSVRELELLRLVAAGHSNQEIAQELILAVGTVKKHLNNIFGKLEVQSRTQAIVRAHELNLL